MKSLKAKKMKLSNPSLADSESSSWDTVFPKNKAEVIAEMKKFAGVETLFADATLEELDAILKDNFGFEIETRAFRTSEPTIDNTFNLPLSFEQNCIDAKNQGNHGGFAIGIKLDKICQINANYFLKVLKKKDDFSFYQIKHELRTHIAIYLLFEKAKELEEFEHIKNTHIPYVIPKIFKTSDGQYGIAMEAVDYDLINYFSQSPKATDYFKKFTNENFKHNFKELFDSLRIFERVDFIHYDLAIENILVKVDEEGNLMDFYITDFGGSRYHSANTGHHFSVYPLNWRREHFSKQYTPYWNQRHEENSMNPNFKNTFKSYDVRSLYMECLRLCAGGFPEANAPINFNDPLVLHTYMYSKCQMQGRKHLNGQNAGVQFCASLYINTNALL
jgi:serine/threonine protein kinase